MERLQRSGLWCCLSVVSCSCFHHDSHVFLPSVASVTVWARRQLKTSLSSLALLKVGLHEMPLICPKNEKKTEPDKRSWPLSPVHTLCSFLSVYPSVRRLARGYF